MYKIYSIVVFNSRDNINSSVVFGRIVVLGRHGDVCRNLSANVSINEIIMFMKITMHTLHVALYRKVDFILIPAHVFVFLSFFFSLVLGQENKKTKPMNVL